MSAHRRSLFLFPSPYALPAILWATRRVEYAPVSTNRICLQVSADQGDTYTAAWPLLGCAKIDCASSGWVAHKTLLGLVLYASSCSCR